MCKRGKISPARAARILGVHRNTVYNWAREAARGESTRLKDVERHPVTGYILVSRAEIQNIKDQKD